MMTAIDVIAESLVNIANRLTCLGTGVKELRACRSYMELMVAEMRNINEQLEKLNPDNLKQ